MNLHLSGMGHLYGPFALGTLYPVPGSPACWYFVHTHDPGDAKTNPVELCEDDTPFGRVFPQTYADTDAVDVPQTKQPPDSWEHLVCGEFQTEYEEEAK